MAGTVDHPIVIAPAPGRVRVIFAGVAVADSAHALVLRESSYPPVAYVPRADVDMSLLAPTDRRTRCPYKGEASYFSVQAGGRVADNAVWSYEQPKQDVAAIAQYLAFYPDKVDAIEGVPS